MKSWSVILFALAYLLYVAFTLLAFPIFGESVVILIIPLMAIGGWIFGTTRGLLLIILTIIYHYILLSEVHADLLIYYEDKFLGVLVLITVILLTGNLRKKLNAIQAMNQKLDLLVEKRNAELTALAFKLIDDSEQENIAKGQSLHDGIGQYMTGIQLFCSPLAERLLSNKNPNSGLAFSIQRHGKKTHNIIRQVARMMFPIKMEQVGLIPALHELASFFSEIEPVEFNITAGDILPELPTKTALQLYRICQENSNYVVYELHATQVDIEVSSTHQLYSLKFSHNGLSQKTKEQPYALQLTEYRLQLISGDSEKFYSRRGVNRTLYTLPNPKKPTFS